MLATVTAQCITKLQKIYSEIVALRLLYTKLLGVVGFLKAGHEFYPLRLIFYKFINLLAY